MIAQVVLHDGTPYLFAEHTNGQTAPALGRHAAQAGRVLLALNLALTGGWPADDEQLPFQHLFLNLP